MKKIAYLLPSICLATLTISAIPAHANPLNLAPFVGQTVSMTVEPYASGETNGSFFVGLTQVKIGQGGTSLGSTEAFCDDFTHEISVPDTYSAVVTAVAGNTTLEEEAYYGTMFGSTPSGNSTMDSDIQELIWDLSGAHYTLNTEMTALQSQMQNNYASANYSNDFYLNAGNGGQSFMVTDPSPVPEPSTLATFGTGLLAAAGFTRRRFLRS
jgi:PEP-CTERM motif